MQHCMVEDCFGLEFLSGKDFPLCLVCVLEPLYGEKKLVDAQYLVISLLYQFEICMVSGFMVITKSWLLLGDCYFGALGSSVLELWIIGVLVPLLVVNGVWHIGLDTFAP